MRMALDMSMVRVSGAAVNIPDALLVSDFVNEEYSLLGETKVFADLWTLAAAEPPGAPQATLVPGTGLTVTHTDSAYTPVNASAAVIAALLSDADPIGAGLTFAIHD